MTDFPAFLVLFLLGVLVGHLATTGDWWLMGAVAVVALMLAAGGAMTMREYVDLDAERRKKGA